MGRGTMTIDDGVIKHTYYPKPRAKAYMENFDMDEDKDWLGYLHVQLNNMDCARKDIVFTRRWKEMAFGTLSLRYRHRVEESSLEASRQKQPRESCPGSSPQKTY
ncbi:hypothetical protein Tco_0271695 [Tanacetum coccineum]